MCIGLFIRVYMYMRVWVCSCKCVRIFSSVFPLFLLMRCTSVYWVCIYINVCVHLSNFVFTYRQRACAVTPAEWWQHLVMPLFPPNTRAFLPMCAIFLRQLFLRLLSSLVTSTRPYRPSSIFAESYLPLSLSRLLDTLQSSTELWGPRNLPGRRPSEQTSSVTAISYLPP